MTDKQHLTRPVVLEPTEQPKPRMIGFERKPVSDHRKIAIEGLAPSSSYRVRKDPRLRD